jgi:alkylation response protein AidB-like acyl-CoA dehydrogenase
VSVTVERPDVVRAAEALVPLVDECADDVEASGRVPDEIVEQLARTGLYHLYLPRSMGGPEVDPVSAFLAVEALSRADGSVGWCAHVSSANAYQLATLAPEAVAAMGCPPRAVRSFSGSNRPLGRARRVEGGYLVDGRWDFASNCLHADWYCGACVVEEDGRRRVRGMFIPATDGEVVQTWQVAGLRGTGSHDFVARDVFVPDDHVPAGRHLAAAAAAGPLYTQRLTMVVNWVLTAAVALGVAQGAVDAFVEISGEGTAHGVDAPLRERAEVQSAVGRAVAMLGAARAYCLHSTAEVWAVAREAHGNASDAELAERVGPLVPAARMAIPYAMQVAVEVVDVLFHAAGTRGIYNRHRIERRFRDAHVAVQHFAGSTSHLAAGGRMAMGLPPGAPFW